MKLSFALILCLLIFSCQEKRISCEEQREKAKTDFKNNKFIYFEHVQRNDSIDVRQEFKQLLNENNIEVVFGTFSPAGCIPRNETDHNNEFCYQEMMMNNLYAKFGNTFFDSLKTKAQNIHSKKLKHQ
ncbi:MAG: hypothetical protein WCJ72_10055 [Chryseobacterium sp.]